MKIDITRDDLTHIIHREVGYYDRGRSYLSDKQVNALVDYLCQDGIIKSYRDILDYVFRSSFYTDLTEVLEELNLPPDSGWDAVLDNDEVEYVDQDTNLVILS